MQSARLDEIISRQESAANLLVVFLDIEKYSQRRTRAQKDVVDEFTRCVDRALTKTAQKYIGYTQNNNYNFATDVIKIPTGDGAAIGFAFDGLHDIHLQFAIFMLNEVAEVSANNQCPIFDRDHWCNCHVAFNLRTGIAQGKTVVYKDINGNYNAAGSAMNMAARVMGFVDRQQIGLTSAAYDEIVDMSDDPMLSEKFAKFENVGIKHGLTITVYQYIDKSVTSLNCEKPSPMQLRENINKLQESVVAFAAGSDDNPPPFSVNDVLKLDPNKAAEQLLNAITIMAETQSEERARRNATRQQIAKAFTVRPDVIDGETPQGIGSTA